MIHKHLFRLSHILVLMSIIITLPACGTPTTQSPAATEAPSPQPPNVVVSLPPDAVERLDAIASANDWDQRPLAAQHTVFYAFPDTGIAFLLTPTEQGPDRTAADLAGDAQANAINDKMILGGLTVIQDGITKLPQGDYVMTLAVDGKTVLFTNVKKVSVPFEAVIRSLPVALPRPTALITSSQMCVAWNTTQICALVDTPLRTDLAKKLTDAINELANAFPDLKVDLSKFNLDRAIPDAEGFGMIEACAKALSATPPIYTDCRATILTAPAIADSAFGAPQEPGRIVGIDVLVVLEDIQDQIFKDPGLTQPTPVLPTGSYLTYEVLLPNQEPPTRGEPVSTRVREFGPKENFYLPAVSGGVIIGDPVLGSGPSNEEEAIIVNKWTRGRCSGWRWWQCPRL